METGLGGGRGRVGGQAAVSAALPVSDEQKGQLVEILVRGPLAAGYFSDLWTCAVGRRSIGSSGSRTTSTTWGGCCTPWASRRKSRDARPAGHEAAIEHWRREDWPRIKGGARRKASIVFLDETGFSSQPLNRRTWRCAAAARATRLAAAGSLERDRQFARLAGRAWHFFRIHSHNVLSRRWCSICAFCTGSWAWADRGDGSPAGPSHAARRLQREVATWLTVEWLPGYAPELNPVDAWSTSKYSRLANYLPDTVDDLYDAVVTAVGDVALDQPLLRSFFHSAHLRFN